MLFMQRITIPEIKKHPWFLNKLPKEFMEELGEEEKKQNDVKGVDDDDSYQTQSIEEILSIIQEARKPGEGPKVDGQFVGGGMDPDEMDEYDDLDDMETSDDFDFVCEVWVC